MKHAGQYILIFFFIFFIFYYIAGRAGQKERKKERKKERIIGRSPRNFLTKGLRSVSEQSQFIKVQSVSQSVSQSRFSHTYMHACVCRVTYACTVCIVEEYVE